jgi:hypothetical protein
LIFRVTSENAFPKSIPAGRQRDDGPAQLASSLLTAPHPLIQADTSAFIWFDGASEKVARRSLLPPSVRLPALLYCGGRREYLSRLSPGSKGHMVVDAHFAHEHIWAPVRSNSP